MGRDKKPKVAGAKRMSEMQRASWLELRRHAFQVQSKWKTTLFQAELALLVLGLPLALGSNPQGPARYGILLSALSSTLSMISGIISLIRESCQLRDMEARERHRIRSCGDEDQENVPAGVKGSKSTALFVSFAVLSFLSLYLFVGFSDLISLLYSFAKRFF